MRVLTFTTCCKRRHLKVFLLRANLIDPVEVTGLRTAVNSEGEEDDRSGPRTIALMLATCGRRGEAEKEPVFSLVVTYDLRGGRKRVAVGHSGGRECER